MREQDARVPPEVEQYLIELFARAGQIGGDLGGGSAGGRGGARGGATGARRLKTVVEDREVVTSTARDAVPALVTDAYPRTIRLPAESHILRLAIPPGMTGLQQVVVDLALGTPESADANQVLVRAYAKEGFLSRKPAARIADEVAKSLQS